MGVKVDYDTGTRLVTITEVPVIPAGASVGQQTLDVEIDLYSDAKEDWKLNSDGNKRKNRSPFTTAESAGDALPGGQVEPAFFRFRNDLGWRILPYDSDHELTLLGNLVPADANLPIFTPRAGRTILVFRDGSQVAQMTSNTVSEAVLTSSLVGFDDPDTIGGALVHLKHLEYKLFINTELISPAREDGSQHFPYSTETLAIDEAEAHGILNLRIMEDFTANRQIKNFFIDSVNIKKFDANGQNIDGSRFEYLVLTGNYSGRITAQNCSLTGVSTLHGFFDNCAMGSSFIVPDTKFALIKGTNTFNTNLDPSTIDIGGASGTAVFIVSNYDGNLIISNCNSISDIVSINLAGGTATFDASCTGGNVKLTGHGIIINNSTIINFEDNVIDPRKLDAIPTYVADVIL